MPRKMDPVAQARVSRAGGLVRLNPGLRHGLYLRGDSAMADEEVIDQQEEGLETQEEQQEEEEQQEAQPAEPSLQDRLKEKIDVKVEEVGPLRKKLTVGVP